LDKSNAQSEAPNPPRLSGTRGTPPKRGFSLTQSKTVLSLTLRNPLSGGVTGASWSGWVRRQKVRGNRETAYHVVVVFVVDFLCPVRENLGEKKAGGVSFKSSHGRTLMSASLGEKVPRGNGPPVDMDAFPEPGLYLQLPDGEWIVMTHHVVETATRAMLDDPEAIPEHVRAAVDYKPCHICPARATAEICHAIMPVLPFFDALDKYLSHEQVTAVYRDDVGLTVVKTSMQNALMFITILSLTEYCEVGQEYACFFDGVNPLMPGDLIAKSVFQSIFLASDGDLTKVRNAINTISTDLLETARCQVKRLGLICGRDSLLNAFVNTEMIMQFVELEFEKHLEARGLGFGDIADT